MKLLRERFLGRQKRVIFGTLGLILILALIGPQSTRWASASTVPIPPADNSACLGCHSQPDTLMTVGGQEVLLTIDGAQYDESAHGLEQLACTDCHTDISEYPHPQYAKSGLREYNYSMYEATRPACQVCHADEAKRAMSGVHQQTLDAGNHNAAMCADCHNPHYAEGAAGRQEVPDVCARCHSEIAATYKESVHGEALLADANPDVPNCAGCHGSHDITDPRKVEFRNSVPLLCAKCHTNAEIMDKYKISTNVLNSYVADYHGTTVTIFEEIAPDQQTNKPVCTDCHGVHNISLVDDPATGIALKENLLVKCQRCHPDATANFPDAWMSHYDASPEKYQLVYYVNLFYMIFIPGVLGGMLVFVLTDMMRRAIHRRKGGTHE